MSLSRNFGHQTAITAGLDHAAGDVVATKARMHLGWVAGAGVEFALGGPWSGKLEYNYMDLGTQRLHFTSATTPLTSDVDIRQRVSVVKAGINYRFGGPVVAKY